MVYTTISGVGYLIVREKRYNVIYILLASLFSMLSVGVVNAQANKSETQNRICQAPIEISKINSLFNQLASKQLKLEFGDKQLSLYDETHTLISPDLYRVEAYAKFQKPGRKNLSTMRVVGWMSICHGTLIIRGNTWLADGRLAVSRYSEKDLPGKGILLGRDSATTKIIAFVDSRCPHCHRLIGYARQLIKDGEIQIEIRQVAYLETIKESLRDTRLSETRLINPSDFNLSDSEYLDMLTGLSNESELNRTTKKYILAKSIVELNTKTAKTVLHVTTVPAILVRGENNQYRLTSFWEMNRLLQPDL